MTCKSYLTKGLERKRQIWQLNNSACSQTSNLNSKVQRMKRRAQLWLTWWGGVVANLVLPCWPWFVPLLKLLGENVLPSEGFEPIMDEARGVCWSPLLGVAGREELEVWIPLERIGIVEEASEFLTADTWESYHDLSPTVYYLALKVSAATEIVSNRVKGQFFPLSP